MQSPKMAKNVSETCFCVVWVEAKFARMKLQTANSSDCAQRQLSQPSVAHQNNITTAETSTLEL